MLYANFAEKGSQGAGPVEETDQRCTDQRKGPKNVLHHLISLTLKATAACSLNTLDSEIMISEQSD